MAGEITPDSPATSPGIRTQMVHSPTQNGHLAVASRPVNSPVLALREQPRLSQVQYCTTRCDRSEIRSIADTTRPLAVVTGASTGIGYELAKTCAESGFDLLIAADEPK